MIPEKWETIEGTPLIKLVMRNGKVMYIHKTFKRVFDQNPLIQQEEVVNISNKMQKEKNLMDRIKNSKIKRRQQKEQQKTEKKEVEVSYCYSYL